MIKTHRHVPPESRQVERALERVPLQAQLHEPVHLLQAVEAVDRVTICTQLAQVSEAFQF